MGLLNLKKIKKSDKNPKVAYWTQKTIASFLESNKTRSVINETTL